MQTVTITCAKAHLSRLVIEVEKGETYIITKRGNALVTFEGISAEASELVSSDPDVSQQ